MWEAAVTTPRLPNESDDDYFDRCCHHADEHGQVARDRGGDFHSLVQRFHESQLHGRSFQQPVTDPLWPQFDAYADWYFKNVRRSLMVEQAVIGDGYAGRVDHVAEMMDGKVLCLDIKSQDTTKKNGKFTYYDQFPVQLGAYAGACKIHIDGLMSVMVSTNLPARVEAKIWERPVSYYHNLFLGLLAYWSHSNNYYPDEKSLLS